MKKFFINAFFMLAIILIVAFILDYITKAGLRKSAKVDFAEMNDVYRSQVNADILILGASRAELMISPMILDSVLSKSTYNLGFAGADFNLEYPIFKLYLQHNKKPKYIIQTIEGRSFQPAVNFSPYHRLVLYLDDTILKNAAKPLMKDFTIPQLYMPLYEFMNHPEYIYEGLKCFSNKKPVGPADATKGYHPALLEWDSSFYNFKKESPNGIQIEVNASILKTYEEYLQFCNANNIKIIFVYTPIYNEELKYENNAYDIMKIHYAFAQKYDIPILDYRKDTLCFNKKYFYNSQHMNKKGATIFSWTLANDLKAIIKN